MKEFPRLLTPAEAAEALHVDPGTLVRWAVKGKIGFIWTPGHTRRYYADEVEAIVRAGQP